MSSNGSGAAGDAVGRRTAAGAPALLVRRGRLLPPLAELPRLTVVTAPAGYGKTTAVRQWARAQEPGRVRWVSAAGRSADDVRAAVGRAATESGPAVVVVDDADRPGSAEPEAVPFGPAGGAPTGSSAPRVVAIVRTVSAPFNGVFGYGRDRDSPDRHDVGPEQLLFTVEDCAALADAAGLSADAVRDGVPETTGLVPALVQAAIAGMRARHPGHAGAVPPQLRDAVGLLLGGADDPDAARRAAIAVASGVTAPTAVAAAAGMPDAPRLHRLLDSAGVFRPAPPVEAVHLVPAASAAVLRSMENGDPAALRAARRAAARAFSADDAAAGLRILLTARLWDLLVERMQRHWPELLDDAPHLLRDLLLALPQKVAARSPALIDGRAMFLALYAGTLDLHAEDPGGSYSLDADGRPLPTAEALTAGTVRAVNLRTAGLFVECDDLTRRMVRMADEAGSPESPEQAASLPVLRLQWGVNYQLTGSWQSAEAQLRLAYAGGLQHGTDFVAKQAAGALAMQNAMFGESRRALQWLDLEDRHPVPAGWLRTRVQVPGMVARAYAHLHRLDLPRAEAALADLGEPDDVEKYWAPITIAQAGVALARGHASEGLDIIGRAEALYSRWAPDGSDTAATLALARGHLLAALGRGNEAITAMRGLPEDLAGVRAVRARLALLAKDPDAALSAVGSVADTASMVSAAAIDMLMVAGAAEFGLGRADRAAVHLHRAESLARRSGCLLPLFTLPAPTRARLREAGVAAPWLEEVWRTHRDVELYPAEVRLVSLTGREQAVLELVAEGVPRRGIARSLEVSENTVKAQLRTLYKKLAAASRDEAVEAARRFGLL